MVVVVVQLGRAARQKSSWLGPPLPCTNIVLVEESNLMTTLFIFDWTLQRLWLIHSFIQHICWTHCVTVPSAEDTSVSRQAWTCSQGAYVLEEDRLQTGILSTVKEIKQWNVVERKQVWSGLWRGGSISWGSRGWESVRWSCQGMPLRG